MKKKNKFLWILSIFILQNVYIAYNNYHCLLNTKILHTNGTFFR